MSKAFVKEDDGAQDDDALELDKLANSTGTRYITPAGFRRIELELERLWSVDRPKVTNEVSEAAAHGDRSENAEYIYGKRKLRQIDSRIRYLSKLLDRLTVVVPDPAQEGRIFFGASVEVEDEKGARHTYRLVGPDESNVDTGEISIESPVGKALLGKCVGDEIIVRRPKGEIEFTVLRIWYETTYTTSAQSSTSEIPATPPPDAPARLKLKTES